MTQPLLQAADLRGAVRLTAEAVAGLASLVEAMHVRIGSLPSLLGQGGTVEAPERAEGVTGFVYETVRGVTQLAGQSAEALLGCLAPFLAAADPHQAPRPEREAVLAALNGVLGNHLAATASPLAIPMQFRQSGQPLRLERHAMRQRLGSASPKPLVMLHGLCMSDLQWRHAGHDHGMALAQKLGYTPIYLHYNSGLSVSTNGRILAQLMETLCAVWPVPIERLVMIGHSMGGLVARSAVYHAGLIPRGAPRWLSQVSDLVCLGTPHQGAPLERIAQGVEQMLDATPYAAPFARLGRLRSAGIKDLALGNILREPGKGDDMSRSERVSLPGGVRCYAVAGSLGSGQGRASEWLLGDGVVPVGSALGQHDDPDWRLDFAAERRTVVYRTGHLALLSSTEVERLLLQWLH